MFPFSANNFDNKNLLGHTNLAFLTENEALEQTTRSNLDWLEFKQFFWYVFLMLGCREKEKYLITRQKHNQSELWLHNVYFITQGKKLKTSIFIMPSSAFNGSESMSLYLKFCTSLNFKNNNEKS